MPRACISPACGTVRLPTLSDGRLTATDFGCTPSNIRATKMSFELYGAIKSREFLLYDHKAPQDLADGVAEVRQGGDVER